jgi:hypothetical protein
MQITIVTVFAKEAWLTVATALHDARERKQGELAIAGPFMHASTT